MYNKTGFSIDEWLDLHHLSSNDVLFYCKLIEGVLKEKERNTRSLSEEVGMVFDFNQTLESLVLPALKMILVEQKCDFSKIEIFRYRAGAIPLPYTEWDEKLKIPKVHLV